MTRLITPFKQRVARGQSQVEGWCCFKILQTAGVQSGDHQSETGDCYGEWIDVDAGDLAQRPLHQFTHVRAWLSRLPPLDQPVEGAEEEVSRSASRVDD